VNDYATSGGDPLDPRSAERLARAARAARSLSELLWEALHEELRDPPGQLIGELSERLANVSATVAVLARCGAGVPPAQQMPRVAAPPMSTSVRAPHDERPFPGESPEADNAFAAERLRSPAAERPSAGERPSAVAPSAEEPSAVERSSGGASTVPVEGSSTRRDASAAVLVDEWVEGRRSAPSAGVSESPGIQIRDERREQAHPAREQAPWIASIERRLERYERDRVPFAVLLLELADVERLRHSELPGEVARLTGLVETVLANELRPADSLTRESPGRYWLLTPQADALNARALAERLAEAVRDSVSHRGAPLQLAIGIALCPADGHRAAALAAHADMALYAARSTGRPLAS
jgi:GGDEF domain-containing protein